jgi:hypothetical protein
LNKNSTTTKARETISRDLESLEVNQILLNKIIHRFLLTTKVKTRVTKLGEILPFGRFIMAFSEFFSRKNSPMIWAKF